MVAAQYPDQLPTPTASGTAPYVPIIGPAMRAVLPYIPDDLWTFFSFAAAHRDELNLIYPGVRAFMGFGYSSNQVDPLYQRCIKLGLLRLIQERGRDTFGRWQPAVYQVNPLLVYIDPRRQSVALEMGTTGFNPLPGGYPDRRSPSSSDQVTDSPDLGHRSESDQAQDQVESNLREEPDLRFLSESDQVLFDQKQNQKAESSKQNHQEESEGESDKQNQTASNVDTHIRDTGAEPKRRVLQGQGQNATGEAQRTQSAAPKNSAKRTPNAPQPPASPVRKTRGDGTLKPYYQPMAMKTDELVAVLFVKTARDTKVEYARMYVDRFGAEVVNQALIRYASCDEQKRRSFKSPTGIMVTWMEEIQRQQNQQRASLDTQLYDIGDPYECQLAAVDDSLSDDERTLYRDTYLNVHHGSEMNAIWEPQMLNFKGGLPHYESDEEVAARIESSLRTHRMQKEQG